MQGYIRLNTTLHLQLRYGLRDDTSTKSKFVCDSKTDVLRCACWMLRCPQGGGSRGSDFTMPQIFFSPCNYEHFSLKKTGFTMADMRTQFRVTTALQGARRLAHSVLGPRPPAQQLCTLRHQRNSLKMNPICRAESGSSPESRNAEEPEALPLPDTEAAPLQEPRDDDVSCCTRHCCIIHSVSTASLQRIVSAAIHCDMVLCMKCSKAGRG